LTAYLNLIIVWQQAGTHVARRIRFLLHLGTINPPRYNQSDVSRVGSTSRPHLVGSRSTLHVHEPRWYREGSDPAMRLFRRHVNPALTTVYLPVTAELFEAASDRLGRYATPLSTAATP
jgi:hypothetical protein